MQASRSWDLNTNQPTNPLSLSIYIYICKENETETEIVGLLVG